MPYHAAPYRTMAPGQAIPEDDPDVGALPVGKPQCSQSVSAAGLARVSNKWTLIEYRKRPTDPFEPLRGSKGGCPPLQYFDLSYFSSPLERGDLWPRWDENHRLLDGVGTNGVFTEGPQVLYMLLCVALSAHVCATVWHTCCHMLPLFVVPLILVYFFYGTLDSDVVQAGKTASLRRMFLCTAIPGRPKVVRLAADGKLAQPLELCDADELGEAPKPP